jgi:K+-transporting ATPase ATPase C chain
MHDILSGSLRASLVTLVLCGLFYPLALVGLGQVLLPFQANGSLETDAAGVVVGSRLIGQNWTGAEWFHGRPSATTGTDSKPAPYNAAASGASNLGPSSKALTAQLELNRKAWAESHPASAHDTLPADVLTTSSSGLDPDISPAHAALQVDRVAAARGIASSKVAALVAEYTTGRSLGVFGEPRVNVLALNLALQRTYPKREPRER